MREIYKKIFAVLDRQGRIYALVLFSLFLALGVLESVGAASILPFIAVVTDPSTIQNNTYLNQLYTSLEFTDTNSFLILLGGIVFSLLMATLVCGLFTSWFLYRFVQYCISRLSTRVLHSYLNRPYSWFMEEHSSELGKTVLTEVTRAVTTVILPAMNLVSRALIIIFLLGVVLLVDPMIALVAAGVLGGLYLSIFLYLRRKLSTVGVQNFEANARRFKVAEEALAGIKEVKVFGLEDTYLRRYLGAAREYARTDATYNILSAAPRYVLEAIAFGGILVIVLVLLTVDDGGLGRALPTIALFAFAGYRLMPALQNFYHALATIKVGTVSLDRIHRDIATSNLSQEQMQAGIEALFDHEANNGGTKPIVLTDEIRLQDINFSYGGSDRPTLTNLNVDIPVNSSIGIVGSSGSGKSTLIDILLGVLSPDRGQILIDGKPLGPEDMAGWREAIGYVPQDIFLIDDTIAANIALRQEDDIDLPKVRRAAELAGIRDFVENNTDMGFETMVGERGIRLSGGQRQRIGIARALYKDPQILLFDEATSALDNRTETEVMAAVKALSTQKTTVMVAHRLSTIRHCDKILVLEEGEISAVGSYTELFKEENVV